MFQVASVRTTPPSAMRHRLSRQPCFVSLGPLAPAGFGGQAAIDPNVAPTRRRPGARGRAPDGDRPAGPLPRHRPRRRTGLAPARPVLPVRRPRLAPARPPGRSRRAALSRFRRAPPSTRRSGSRSTRVVVFRGIAELDRAVVAVEDSGWNAAARAASPRPDAPTMPAYILELGANLLSSCPSGGVLLTGQRSRSALGLVRQPRAPPHSDILPIRPDLYATDSLYRLRMAAAMGVDPALPVQRALAEVADRRTLCLSPTTDSAAAPALAGCPFRLVRVSRAAAPGPDALARDRAAQGVSRQGSSPWVARRPGGLRPRPPGTTLCSAAVCSSSSGTRPRRHAVREETRRERLTPRRSFRPLRLSRPSYEPRAHRQSRRDRASHHPRLPRRRARGGRRLFRRGPRRAARARGRPRRARSDPPARRRATSTSSA